MPRERDDSHACIERVYLCLCRPWQAGRIVALQRSPVFGEERRVSELLVTSAMTPRKTKPFHSVDDRDDTVNLLTPPSLQCTTLDCPYSTEMPEKNEGDATRTNGGPHQAEPWSTVTGQLRCQSGRLAEAGTLTSRASEDSHRNKQLKTR